jgi:outer membrane protein
MNKKLQVVLMVALLGTNLSIFAADVNIGVVDRNKVAMDSPQLAAARTELKAKFESREKDLMAKQTAFKADVDAYGKNSPTMNKQAKDAAQKKLMDEQKALQTEQEKFQKDLMDAQGGKTKAIEKQIEASVSDVAASKKFDLVIEKAAVVYSKANIDITSEVIAKMKKSGNAAASEDSAKSSSMFSKIIKK